MKRTIILIILLLAVLGLIGYGLFTAFQNFTNIALEPIRSANEDIRTQVAKVLHPTPTIIPDPVTIINEVRSIARLETIQYTVEKVVTAEIGQEFLGDLFGDRLLFIAHGVVIAGVDLSKLTVEDLELRDGLLTIDLPDVEVFIATLDNDKSYVYDRQTGLLRKSEVDLETQARQIAEDEIYKAALADGILGQANANAELFMERLLNDLGFEVVVFVPYEPKEGMIVTTAPEATAAPAQ
jgi:hypothetical protein